MFRRQNRLSPLAFLVTSCVYSGIGFAQPSTPKFLDEVSYSNDIRPVVKNFCATCHAGEDPEGDFVLTEYDDVRQHAEHGALLDRINEKENPMPPSGRMPKNVRRLFQTWADQGYVNQGKAKKQSGHVPMQTFTPPRIVPIDIETRGFDLLEKLQGHWVGSMNLMGQPMDWMAFDYRPIAPSHIHGLFEGGTIGNLFTSFFVAEYKGKKAIFARNGGTLNGIYRTSYFVLDDVKNGNGWSHYRLVDAYGGRDVMYMELTFHGNQLEFNAFTSRLGLTAPRPHMAFQGTRMHPELAIDAAKAVGFPKKVADYKFPDDLPEPTWTEDYPQTSATYIWEDTSKTLIELGRLSKDPRRIDQIPYLSELTVEVERNPTIEGKPLLIYLSRDALVDQHGKFLTRYGYIRNELLNTLLLFPEVAKSQSRFRFTYLHPGDYYLTVIADMDNDGFPSPGDFSHRRQQITVKPESKQSVKVAKVNVLN